MAFKQATRSDDDHLLRLLAMRRRMSSADAGKLTGTASAAVRIATNRVRNADLDESGESAEVLLPHYQFCDGRV
jgi:hypothetical protein